MFRIKKSKRNVRGKNINVLKKKGVPVKNPDFSYENFNLNKYFEKSNLDLAVLSKMNKTINLVRIFELLPVKQTFAKWAYVNRMSASNDDLKAKMNYKTIKLLTFWDKKESNVKAETKRESVAPPSVKENKNEVELQKKNSKSSEAVEEKVEKIGIYLFRFF